MKKPKESKDNLLYQFCDAAQNIFVLYDKDLCLIYINKAGLKLSFLPKEKLIGMHITELNKDVKESGRLKQYEKIISTGKQVIFEDVVANPGHGNLHFRIKAFKVGEGMGMIVSDITDLRNTLEELETFSFQASHDMRSPVASIQGLISIAKKDTFDLSSALHFYEMIDQQAKRMEIMLLSLLESSKIRSIRHEYSQINFKFLIDSIRNSLEFMTGYNELHVSVHILNTEKFYTDKTLLTSIFQNLIVNAIKYRKQNFKGAFLKITVANEKLGVKILFEDNGIGIPSNLHQDVFKMFFRATEIPGGNGLGLYSVKNSVTRLRGTILIDSAENEGTSFTVLLPSIQPEL